jgi:hypothetical protein
MRSFKTLDEIIEEKIRENEIYLRHIKSINLKKFRETRYDNN